MSKTILLADDSVTIQKVVELTFMDQDYEVVAVSDGKAALAKLSELQPALLIADVHMPGADGYEVCRQSKEIYSGLPVLLLVGTFEPFDEQQAVACGADGHLKKPFDSQDLLAQVESLAGSSSPPPAVGFAAPAPLPEVSVPEVPVSEAPVPEVPVSKVSELEPPSLTENAAADVPVADIPTVQPSFVSEPLPDVASPAATVAADPLPAHQDASDNPFELPPLEPQSVETPSSEASAEVPAPGETSPIELPSVEDDMVQEEVALSVADVEAPPSVEALSVEAPPVEAPSEEAEPAATAGAEVAAGAENGDSALSEQDVDRIARRVTEMVGEKLLREVAWEVVPDLAELIIKERIRELESQVE